MNLIQNPTFANNGEGWQFHADGGGTFVVDGQTAVLTIKAAGNNVQFYQAGITLQPATRYRLRFHAWSSDGSALSVHMHRHTPPNDLYGLAGTVIDIGVEPLEFEVFFTTPESGPLDNGRLRFWFAPFAAAGTVYRIAGVELVEAPAQPTEPEPEPEPEPSPVDLSRQLSVIVRDIPPGGWHEVRHVRPADLVVVDGNIDWTQTVYTSHILQGGDGTADD